MVDGEGGPKKRCENVSLEVIQKDYLPQNYPINSWLIHRERTVDQNLSVLLFGLRGTTMDIDFISPAVRILCYVPLPAANKSV